jgi:hypothetical protein
MDGPPKAKFKQPTLIPPRVPTVAGLKAEHASLSDVVTTPPLFDGENDRGSLTEGAVRVSVR